MMSVDNQKELCVWKEYVKFSSIGIRFQQQSRKTLSKSRKQEKKRLNNHDQTQQAMNN